MEPLIALEEHYFAATSLLPPHINELYAEQFKHVPQLEDKLKSLDDLRLKEMAIAGVTYQIISHAPGISSLAPAECAKINDYLASRIASQKTKFGALATLPMGHPEDASAELRRCVSDLGFLGALIDNHLPIPLSELTSDTSQASSSPPDATFYDSPYFHPIWATAQALNVPIYIHPTFPTPSMKSHYIGSYHPGAAASLATSGWSWHSDVGSHILRLFASGLFDTFPHLKLIIGHFGEMLPSMLGRVKQLSYRWGERQRGFQTVWDENIYITTSGVWGVEPLYTIERCVKTGNVLFSIDWPFAKAEWGREFWEEVGRSGVYGEEELRGIGWGNAVRLFGLDEAMLVEAAKAGF